MSSPQGVDNDECPRHSYRLYGKPELHFDQYLTSNDLNNGLNLFPGDVIINMTEGTVEYVRGDGSRVQWTSIDDSISCPHPLVPNYILVPMQTRFSWVPRDGFPQYHSQAIASNPKNDILVWIKRFYAQYFTHEALYIEMRDPDSDDAEIDDAENIGAERGEGSRSTSSYYAHSVDER